MACRVYSPLEVGVMEWIDEEDYPRTLPRAEEVEQAVRQEVLPWVLSGAAELPEPRRPGLLERLGKQLRDGLRG